MTSPELEAFRTELIQTAAVIVSALEDIDYGEANVHRSLEQMTRQSVDHTWQPTGEFVSSQTDVILQLVKDERVRQDLKWGPQHHRIADWLAIIGEEYGEACMAYVDDLLMPTILEQKRIELDPPAPIKWGDRSAREILAEGYGTPTTMRVDQIAGYPEVLVRRAAARLAGGAPMPLVVDKEGNVVDDGLDDDDWVDPQEGRFDREDD